jgi:hypothetical protein
MRLNVLIDPAISAIWAPAKLQEQNQTCYANHGYEHKKTRDNP